MTTFIRLGILGIKFLQNSSGISQIQTNLIASIRVGIFEGCLSATLSLRTAHELSIRLRSKLFSGDYRRVIFGALKKTVTIFEQWHGAPSCIKIVQSCTDMCSCSFSFIKFKYLWSFIVVRLQKEESGSSLPLIEMALPTITLGGYFTLSWVYFLLCRVPGDRRTFLFLAENC